MFLICGVRVTIMSKVVYSDNNASIPVLPITDHKIKINHSSCKNEIEQWNFKNIN